MAQPQGRWPVAVRGEGRPVSRRGCSADGPRQTSRDVEAAEAPVVARVQAIAAETRPSSGSRRMAQPLQDDGVAVGRYHARRLRRPATVTVARPQTRGPVTTDSRHRSAVAPHVVARPLAVEPPAPVWGGDMISIWTSEGWWYLAV
jgi:transposase InsO family protein